MPQHLKSRLDLFDSPASATASRNAAKDGFLPVWTDERLRGAIPDSAVRRRFVSAVKYSPGGHFRMLTAPAEVADEVVALIQGLTTRGP